MVRDSQSHESGGICGAECPVAVADQVRAASSQGKASAGDPFGVWMSGNAEPEQPPTRMTQDHQAVEQLKKAVGTTKKSIDAKPAARLRRKFSSFATAVDGTSEPCIWRR
jgi:hypothetical protein